MLDRKRFRVVGVHNEDADDYHLCMTNLAIKEFLPVDLAEIYRCRWEVELLFQELILLAIVTRRILAPRGAGNIHVLIANSMKTRCELDVFDTRDEHVVRIISYAALLSLLVSRGLLDLVTEQADDKLVFLIERCAASFNDLENL